jgi:hypothetical protein
LRERGEGRLCLVFYRRQNIKCQPVWNDKM